MPNANKLSRSSPSPRSSSPRASGVLVREPAGTAYALHTCERQPPHPIAL